MYRINWNLGGGAYFLGVKIGVVGAIIVWLEGHNKTASTNNFKIGCILKINLKGLYFKSIN